MFKFQKIYIIVFLKYTIRVESLKISVRITIRRAQI